MITIEVWEKEKDLGRDRGGGGGGGDFSFLLVGTLGFSSSGSDGNMSNMTDTCQSLRQGSKRVTIGIDNSMSKGSKLQVKYSPLL